MMDLSHGVGEPDRLEALRRTALLDTQAEEPFDRLARLAARLLQAPVALVSLVDDHRHFLKSCVGLPEPWASRREIPLSRQTFCQYVVTTGEPLLVEDARIHPLGQDNLPVDEVGVIAYLGVPLMYPEGHTLGSFCVIDYRPRHWSDEDVALLRDLGATVMREIAFRQVSSEMTLQTERLQHLYRLADVVSRATTLDAIYAETLDGLERTLHVDRASILLFDPDGVMRFKAWRGLPDYYRRLAEGHSPWPPDAQHPQSVLVPDVKEEPSLATLQEVILGEGIRALGFIPLVYQERLLGKFMLYYDTPHQFRDQEVQLAQTIARHVAHAIVRKQAEEDLRFQKTLLELQSQASIDGILVVSTDGNMLSFNRRFVEMWGIPDDVVASRSDEAALRAVHAQLADPEEFLARVAYLYAHPDEESRDEIRLKDGRIFDRHSAPIAGPEDRRYGRIWFFRDITESRREEERWAFLAEASGRLAESLDYQETLAMVAQLAVPRLADRCFVHVLRPDGTLPRAAFATADPSKSTLLEELERLYTLHVDMDHPVVDVLRTGQTRIIAEIDNSVLERMAVSADHLALLRSLSARSYLVAPLRVRGRTIGGMLFVAAESRRPYEDHDLAMAEELARRAAYAVDNASLYRDAQDAVRARDEFLSVAAHELKTPVTSLRGFAQLLLRRLDRSGMIDLSSLRQALQTIDQQSEKLTRLVNNLLDVTRIEAGRLVLEQRPTDLTGLVAGVAAVVQTLTTRHTIEVRAPRPVFASVDPLRLEQVVINLLDNAIKYSPDGGRIEIELMELATDAVQLTVRDHGLGIPHEQRHRLFDRFYQAHREQYSSGLGLGLYISRQIVELHRGQLVAEFPSDGGTRFTVSLPRSVT